MKRIALKMTLLTCLLTVLGYLQIKAQDGSGSITTSNEINIINSGSTIQVLSESLFFGPESSWRIDGTVEIYSKYIWISPDAVFTGDGKIVFYNPSGNPLYPAMTAATTTIDGNRSISDNNTGGFFDVNIELRNNEGLHLSNISLPSHLGNYPVLWTDQSTYSGIKIGKDFDMAVDGADVTLGATGEGSLLFTGHATLSNYSPLRMIITNNSTVSGVYKQYNPDGETFTYPVGIADGDYTPARISYGAYPGSESNEGMYCSVTDYAASSADESTIINSNTGVDRTWMIKGSLPVVKYILTLQHNGSTRQTAFDPDNQYITQWGAVSPNTSGDYDASLDAWQNNAKGAGEPGDLSTIGILTGASKSSHEFLANTPEVPETSYYTLRCDPTICLKLRAYLEGSLLNNGGATAPDGRPLMRDNLRVSPFTSANYIPARDPYQFPTAYVDVTGRFHMVSPGTRSQYQRVTDSASVFRVSGRNAIVDWMYIELRNKNNSSLVVATRSGLIQRDGDIVDVDGTSCLSFPGVVVDNYYVAVRHRSHLGVMTSGRKTPTQLEALIDFTATSTALFDFGTTREGLNYTGLATNNSVKTGYRALWAGDVDANGKVKFDNPSGDDNVLYFDLINFPNNIDGLTTYNAAYGYWQGDYDMNSKLKYDNPSGDHNLLYFQAINYPINYDGLTTYDHFIQQIP